MSEPENKSNPGITSELEQGKLEMLRKRIPKFVGTQSLPLAIRGRVYRVAKALKILKVPEVSGEAPAPDEEDLRVAEAGLEDFVTCLAKEEE